MAKYEALLVAPDGAFVTDFKEDTIEKVQEDLADRGSRWYFYPYEFIIEAHRGSDIWGDKYRHIDSDFLKKKIVDAPEPLNFMKGWTVGKVIKKIVAENSKLKEGGTLWGLWRMILCSTRFNTHVC